MFSCHDFERFGHVFFPVINVYFNDMQICKYANKQLAICIKLASGEIHFAALIRKKNRPEKCPFLATNNWIVLAVRRSVKYLFDPNSLLFWKTGQEKKKKKGN